MPLAIMQGYMTIVQEFLEQVQGEMPTHVFLQAGVGSFSGGLAAHLRHVAREARVVIVEAREADCIFQSVARGDGAMVTIEGDLASIMAGLCCGVPSVQGWPILRSTASAFLSCTDSVSSRGMRVLYSPLAGDTRVVSGESGSVCVGAVYTLMTRAGCEVTRRQLGLGPALFFHHCKLVVSPNSQVWGSKAY